MAEPVARRRTQAERKATTRTLLLEATVDSLYARGYVGTTTLEVQRRAGVSRGTLLYHFGSRADLMAAAVEHVSQKRLDEATALVNQAPPSTRRTEWAVAALWATFDGPLFAVTLQLWQAALSDTELLSALLPHERLLGRSIRTKASELFDHDPDDEVFMRRFEVLIDAMRGAAARTAIRSGADDARLLATWVALMSSS
ncbi:MAG: transcriptional regulator [Frankiales bacterium]|nr:transcriptional regulator [Frankiales bacterium]